MEKEDSFEVMSSSSGSRDRNNGNGRISWSRRTPGQGNRGWSRISLGGLGSARRRDKEPKVLASRSSPRRLTLGGDVMGAGGTAYHGKHGIRYKQPFTLPMTEEIVEGFKLEESSKDQSTSLLASPLLRRLPGLEADAITEEGDSPLEEDGENGDGERQGKDNDENKCSGENDEDVNRSKHGQRRDNTSRGVRLLDLRIDNGMERMGSGALRPVSPSSRRESGSPGRISDNRPRTQSWAPDMASPVLSGPFSRFRSRSRSPRRRFSMALAPTLDSLPVLHGEINRLSSGGSEKITAKEPSVCTVEEYLGWGEGGDGEPLVAPSGDGDGDGDGDGVGGSKEGAFTDSALMMARLRLPNMDLGYEVDGFFGIDVRSLIIEKEIARGAFGVVFEGVLLPHPPEEEGGGDGDGRHRSDANREGVVSSKASPEAKILSSASATSEMIKAGAEGADERGVGTAEEKNTDEEGCRAAAGGHQDQGTKVAVKIQQVPEDEEEQANLLGELGVLRNYKHPYLVEFIGAALAVERGADTVMVAMELCTNGALREALKLNISWPLKVRIAMDFTDGLQYLHQHDIIHRDIKTPNVLIDSSWRAKLCDYNFAIDEKSSIKQDFCAGTMEFMSPEILMSEDYGLASDVFSLGMIFVEMLTGKEPSSDFPQRTPQAFFAVNEDEIQAEILPDCPPSFSLLQSQCLFYDASDRPTAEDVHSWLQELIEGIGEENVTIPQKEPPLPVLTEGAAIAREGNVVNTSPKQESGHHWLDSDSMEHHIGSMVESVVDRVLSEKMGLLGVSGHGNVVDGENTVRLEDMKTEIKTLRAACEERDKRIASLEVEVMRNTKTFKMLSSALEVAYSKMQTQQALSHVNSELPSVGGLSLRGDESNGIAQQEA